MHELPGALRGRTQGQVRGMGQFAHEACFRHLADVMLPDLSEDRVRAYIRTRQAEGAGNRSINIEVAILARSVGRKRSELWPSVKLLGERTDVGKALAPEEEQRILEASLKAESPLIGPFIRIALTTGMRSGEILGLTWGRVDLVNRFITVGDSKIKASSGRIIPMNADLQQLLLAFAAWHDQHCGGVESDQYLFPFRLVRGRYDSARRMLSIRKAWESVMDVAGVSFRIHDLRHTACSKMAEVGVSEFACCRSWDTLAGRSWSATATFAWMPNARRWKRYH